LRILAWSSVVVLIGIAAVGALILRHRQTLASVENAAQSAVKATERSAAESEQVVKDSVDRAKASLQDAKDVVLPKPTLAELRHRLKSNPSDAIAHRQLGAALFEALRPAAGLNQYRDALKLDPSVANEEMASNIDACFGRPEQAAAEHLIADYKLMQTAPALSAMTANKKYTERWGAVETLKKLGVANRSAYVHAYLADLESRDCGLQRHAVEELGVIGGHPDVAAIRAAAKRDRAAKHWYWFSCLGDRPEQAVKEIETRTRVAMGT
jgi:hypothetical protein